MFTWFWQYSITESNLSLFLLLLTFGKYHSLFMTNSQTLWRNRLCGSITRINYVIYSIPLEFMTVQIMYIPAMFLVQLRVSLIHWITLQRSKKHPLRIVCRYLTDSDKCFNMEPGSWSNVWVIFSFYALPIAIHKKRMK